MFVTNWLRKFVFVTLRNSYRFVCSKFCSVFNVLLVVAETTILSYHARFALSTTSFKKFSSTSLPLRSRSPLPRNALRRFAPSEHILIYQLYSPSSTTFFTCFFYLSFFLFRKLLIVSVLFISSNKSITFVFYENKKISCLQLTLKI